MAPLALEAGRASSIPFLLAPSPSCLTRATGRRTDDHLREPASVSAQVVSVVGRSGLPHLRVAVTAEERRQ